MGRKQIITCWYLSCGRVCRGECCSNLRSGIFCNRCIGCFKRCKARCEDCVTQKKCICCTPECCREQLVGCLCIRECAGRMRASIESKCCGRHRGGQVEGGDEDDQKDDDEEGLLCCMQMKICSKETTGETKLDTATGLSGPALQLHRGGTLLLKRALSGGNDSTSGSIKRNAQTSK